MGRLARHRRGSRLGLSLVEMAITVAIIGIFAGLAGSMMTDALPSWRTRRVAYQFASDIATARTRAIADNVEYRVRLGAFDNDLDGTSPSAGTYYVERGNRDRDSTTWDILPVDLDGSGAQTGEGTVELAPGGQDQQPDVSIEPWLAVDGAIVFSPRGFVTNDAGDFDARGFIGVTFVNKHARQQGKTDEWTAVVSRGGLVRLEHTSGTPVPNPNGIVATSWDGGGSGGYAGGSGGGSGSGAE